LARHHLIADRETLRRQDVGLLAVLVFHQRDEGRTIGIVFQPLNGGRHVELGALEVDDAVAALMAAAAIAHRDMAVVVAPALAALAFGKRLDRVALPQIAAIHQDQRAPAGRGWLEILKRHRLRPPWSRRSTGPRPAIRSLS